MAIDSHRWQRARTRDLPDLTGQPSGVAGSFNAISCVSSTSCVALGRDSYAAGLAGLAARWNGRVWSAMRAPPKAIDAVSCVSRRVCVAVGEGAARWDGSRWSAERLQDPGGGGVSLTSVSCVSRRECFAAGQADTSGPGIGVLEHWSGGRWTVQRASVGEDTGFDSSSVTVSCASARRCVAIVRQITYDPANPAFSTTWFADLWNGHTWSTMRAPAVQSISCVPDLCASIGDGRAAVLDRRGWHVDRSARSPQFGASVSCASRRMCVAVGATAPPGPTQNGLLVTKPAAIRWSGSRWSVATPVPGAGVRPSELRGLSCSSAQACMAVGVTYSDAAATPLAESWNGRKWRLSPPPIPTGGGCSRVFHVAHLTSASRSATRWRGFPTDSGVARSSMFGTAHRGQLRTAHRWPAGSNCAACRAHRRRAASLSDCRHRSTTNP